MSDYMFILESHLSPEQAAVLAAVQSAAGEANQIGRASCRERV